MISAAVSLESYGPSCFHGRRLSSDDSTPPDRQVRERAACVHELFAHSAGGEVARLARSSSTPPLAARMPQALRVKATKRELVCVSGE